MIAEVARISFPLPSWLIWRMGWVRYRSHARRIGLPACLGQDRPGGLSYS
jgi:hypothetical protein